MIPTERLKEIAEGCKGVTPGPWERMEVGASDSFVRYGVAGELCTLHWGRTGAAPAHRDAAHIANCSPEVIHDIVTELLALRAAPAGNELVEELRGAAICALPPPGVPMKRFEERLRNAIDAAIASLSAPSTIRLQALEEAAEAANGVDPDILKGMSERSVSVYCSARVDAAAAIRALAQEKV